jgi:hypothetical protein
MPLNDQPTIYHFRVKGHLDARWQLWFEGLTLTALPSGETEIVGAILDQAALHGYLTRIRDLGLELIYLERISEPDANLPFIKRKE